jgi:hypothetical protein
LTLAASSLATPLALRLGDCVPSAAAAPEPSGNVVTRERGSKIVVESFAGVATLDDNPFRAKGGQFA